MQKELKAISEDMKQLGLAALSRVNNSRLIEDRWAGILSVLQTAHAMEILAKARIAQEHPLLLFDTYPKPKKDNENRITNVITTADLSEKGRTIEWSSIVETLWLVGAANSIDISLFNEFGRVRNIIQHFGIAPNEDISYFNSLDFIYKVIDPFINECWGLYAIDHCQDYNDELAPEDNATYWSFIQNSLIQNEIHFLVSPRLSETTKYWWDEVKENQSSNYFTFIEKQLS